ncbi:MAG: hypothetical protein HDS16_01850 [Bacteroides sp.]|nr:hypothetical protein [Bacteroides sp.]
MKNLFLTLITTGLVSLTAPVVLASGGMKQVSYFKVPVQIVTNSEVELHTVVLDVDYDLPVYQELSGLFAMESTGTDPQVYYGLSEEEDSHIYEFHMPTGHYDFYVGAILGDYEGMMALTLDDVEITEDMDLTLKASSAVYRTDLRHIGPAGNELEFSWGNPSGTVPSAQFIQALTHRDKLMILNGYSTDHTGLSYFISNNQNSNYAITRLDLMHSPQGFLTSIIPIDFSKETCGSDAEGWQMAEENFAKTPANFKMEEYYAAHGAPDYFYGFSPCVMLMNGRTRGTAGIGMFDPACKTNVVGSWAPADYDNTFELWPVPTGSALSGWGSDISGMALKRTPDGLRQVGLNLPADRLIFFRDGNSPVVGDGFDAFSGTVPTAELGNCVPLLMLTPEEEYFEFTFNGRHGETISQASAYYVIPSIEYWADIFGSPLCDLKFYRNDVLICDDRNDFPYDTEWEEPADYCLEISTDNVLIDGEVPGFVKATHTFGPTSSNLMPPTLTSLRIVDSEGHINDRLNRAEGAKALFTGGHFTYNDNYQEGYVYASFDEVSCMSVEYAPRGTDNFASLEVTKESEIILPGYGNLFSADLSSVTSESADGWYDLRISIHDGAGSTQTQHLSPAFRIGEPDAIHGINADRSDIDLTSPDTEIYTPDGRRVNPSAVTKGLYILRTPSRTAKIII